MSRGPEDRYRPRNRALPAAVLRVPRHQDKVRRQRPLLLFLYTTK